MSQVVSFVNFLQIVRENDVASARSMLATDSDLVTRLVDAEHSLFLRVTADKDFVEMAKLLLSTAKADVNRRDANGSTPLMLAATKNHVAMVELLLAQPTIDVDLCDAKKQTPLWWAAHNGHSDVIALLLKAKAGVDLARECGTTPLMTAAICRRASCVAALLEAKANVDLARQDGNTAVILAVQSGYIDGAQLLIAAGADLSKRGRESAKQISRQVTDEMECFFECHICGWEGMCCVTCRAKYCRYQCDKFTDDFNDCSDNWVDCRVHRKLAQRSILEWALALAPLQLPPYVIDHLFECLLGNKLHTEPFYQDWRADNRIAVAPSDDGYPHRIDDNFVRLLMEERTHAQNIQLFIAVHDAYQRRGD